MQDGIDSGLHAGGQLYVSLRGDTITNTAFGTARPGIVMTPEHVVLWMSAGKPLAAVLAATLVGDGLLRLDTPVADLVPDFAQGGKEAITVAHLLTHTGGFRQVSSNWSPEPWASVIERVCRASLESDWIPGETAGYHVASGWYMLAEVCRVVAGVEATDAAVSSLIRDGVLKPFGMAGSFVGMSRHQYVDLGTDSAVTFDTSKPEPKALAFPNSEKGHTLCRPGGNARGTARDLGRFYEQLLIDRGDLPAAVPVTGCRQHVHEATACWPQRSDL